MKLNFRIEKDEVEGKKCEQCGKPLTPENVYSREVKGMVHYFCCSHCADAFERRESESHCC